VAIRSYFYDSVDGDRPYSASDFARAFGIAFENGILKKIDGTLGFAIGGTNNTTIFDGKAVVQGRFVEIIGTETLIVPSGSYSGQVVIHVDADNERTAKLIVKTNRTPIQSATIFELPLYNVTVANGLITDAIDIRSAGGTMPNNHLHPISDITGLQTQLNSTLTWVGQSNGVKCIMGRYNTTGKPVALFLTTTQPSASSTEHRVWIQIDNF
jgi:hypothetical protein